MPIRGCRIIQNGPDPPTVKLGKSFSLKQDMVIALVQAGWKTGTELVGGDTFGKAALSGALKLTGPGVDRLFKIGPAKSFFDKVAVPMWVTIPKDGFILYQVDKGADFAAKFAAKMVQSKVIEKVGKKQILGASSSPDNAVDDSPLRKGQLIEDVTLTNNKFLLYCSVVNMDKGIGRGW
jgi:hypothetical protein